MEFYSNPEVTRYFGFSDNINPENFCRFWFNKVFERYGSDTGGHNVLTNLETVKSVEMCSLLAQEVDGFKELEIGYSLYPAFWGK